MSHPPVSSPALIVRHTGQIFPLTAAPLTIGGHDDNGIILADPEVSRHHAVISWQDGAYVIRDLGSANGTFLDEHRLTDAQPLRHGQVLRMGNTLFDVCIPPAPSSGTGAIPGQPRSSPSAPLEDNGLRPFSAAPLENLQSSSPGRRPALPVLISLLLGGFAVVCLLTVVVLFLLERGRGGPTVIIQSPRDGSTFVIGQTLLLQASASGASDIMRLDVGVDGVVVASVVSSLSEGQPSLTVSQPWTFEQSGAHVVSAVAYTARDRASGVISHQVTVVDSAAALTAGPQPTSPTETPTPTLTATPTPSPTLTITATATITPTATPNVNLPPIIEYFRAVPDQIRAGECATLQWGMVFNAVAATIDRGIGGVATPGGVDVCPPETTRYSMTASGPGGVTTASATITVLPTQPDLIVESIAFFPNPPIQGKDTEVRLNFRNIGTGDASPFDWLWQPGSDAPFRGQVPAGLNAGTTTIVTLVWRPVHAYVDLVTTGRVDVSGTVAESDETNNQLQVNIQVLPSQPTTVPLIDQPSLDGYVIGGQASFPQGEIRVGNINSVSGEQVYRGFLSFDLSAIPAGATIQSVQLRFFQVAIQGNPYQKLGQMILKRVDYGPSLDVEDFAGQELGSLPLSPLASPGTWYTLGADPLLGWLEQDLAAGRPRFQLRLQFLIETDDGLTPDYVQIEAADNTFGTGNLPALTVTYVP